MTQPIKCWRCGNSLAEISLPIRRLDACKVCGVDLHVCRMCREFSATVTNQCMEQAADEVRVKDRANFCDYFQPQLSAFGGASAVASESLKALNDLFKK